MPALEPSSPAIASSEATSPMSLVEIVVGIVEQQRLVSGVDCLHRIVGGFEKGVDVEGAERVFVPKYWDIPP